MRILAIDPGPESSGWALYDADAHEVLGSASETPNADLDTWITDAQGGSAERMFDALAIEDIESYGKRVGASVFVTCKWIGWFMRAWRGPDPKGTAARLIPRRDVKIVMCGGCTYTDPMRGTPRKVGKAEVKGAVQERFPETGGGKRPVIGTIREPGPLHGVEGHAWDALALALAFVELTRARDAFDRTDAPE